MTENIEPVPTARLLVLSRPMLQPNGDLSFTIETSEGNGDIVCSMSDIEQMIAFLIHLAAFVNDRNSSITEQILPLKVPLNGLSLRHIPDSPDVSLIGLHFAGLNFGLRTPNTNIDSIAQEFAGIARVNSASLKFKN